MMKMTASSPALGIRSSRPAKHRPKRFLRKLVNYLKSDSYMFAPIIPSSSSSSKRKYALSPRERFHGNAAGFEIGGEAKKKRLAEVVGDYLRSDSYLYAPLVEGEWSGAACNTTPTSEGSPCLTKKVTTSIARTVLTKKATYQPIDDTEDTVAAKGQTEPPFDTNHELGSDSDQIPKQVEILKQVVFPNCWKPLLSEDDLPINGSIAERVAHRRKIPG